MKIGNQLVHYMKLISGFDHDLRLGVKRVLTCRIEVVEDGLQGFFGCQLLAIGF